MISTFNIFKDFIKPHRVCFSSLQFFSKFSRVQFMDHIGFV